MLRRPPAAAAAAKAAGAVLRTPAAPKARAEPLAKAPRPQMTRPTASRHRDTVGAVGRKAERAQARKGRYAIDERRVDTKELTLLERRSVRPATEQDYHKRYQLFLAWARQMRLPLHTMQELDEAGLTWMHEQFFEGLDGTEGSKLIAVLSYYRFDLTAGARLLLPRSRRAAKGWLKLAPPRSRLPTPWPVAALVADHLAHNGKWWQALFVVLTFAFYLRPSEALGLRANQIVPGMNRGGKAFKHWGLVLFPSELETRSKTGAADESLLNDVEEFSFLDGLLAEVRQVRAPEELVFPFDYPEIAEEFRLAGAEFQLQDVGVSHLYQLRHGGASHDAASQNRDLASIKKRGRWVCNSSVRRYEKGGRSAQVLQRLPDQLRNAALERCQQIGATLAQLWPACASGAKRRASPSSSSVGPDGSRRRGGVARM